jgi:hypothetical protein
MPEQSQDLSVSREANGRFPTGSTPFPNSLLDKVMPRLTDTEWRLICVVVRQTFGWQSGNGKRKTSDWLSHYQLKRRTGRSSSAISRAIDVLARAGLLDIRDPQGQSLDSAVARRHSHHHLIFGLNPDLWSEQVQERLRLRTFRISKSGNDKRNPYKRKEQHGHQLELSTGFSTPRISDKDPG